MILIWLVVAVTLPLVVESGPLTYLVCLSTCKIGIAGGCMAFGGGFLPIAVAPIETICQGVCAAAGLSIPLP